ncbi:hypothetical protein [Mesonia mobilis]|uniref:Uncharacterized protein n=1 Tax=Mesonia mobilis TaxID=369791 RepID=A0ABQ3C2Z9_9FLAO|nr:hypothetical protein [Mesonia mobilis]MBQ0739429.1 hypothetical protein [Aquimarina celericrescens]GGZ65270.1 hypothetical protein GCM10008088_28250 [Mesonia mobilis]
MDSDILQANDSIIAKIKSDKEYSKFLTKINEPNLENLEGETYRFLIIGPWGNSSIYRLNKNADKITLSSNKYWQEINDIQIDSLEKIEKINLKIKDWNKIKNLLNEINYWKSPVRINDNHYLDGTGFIIEGYSNLKNECTNRNYHATSRISPKDTTKYRGIFKKIDQLAKE